jgi:Flp pilus assembly protein TadG
MIKRWRSRLRRRPLWPTDWRRGRGVGIVEFALASLIFLPITLGTLDFGRAIYQYSQFENAVREAARFGKTDPTNVSGMQAKADEYGAGLGIAISASRSASPCNPGLCRLTVNGSFEFDAITTGFLNAVLGGAIPATITITSTATVEVE